MKHPPLIAVPTQTLQAIDGIPQDLPHSWVMNHRYFAALALAGAAPLMVPLLTKKEDALRAIYERVDGVFLAGGVDVDPSSYNEDTLDVCGRTDEDRDAVELMFTRWAIEDGKPLLGVCRGMQIINVACGGSLFQDVAAQGERLIKHDYFPTQGFARDFLSHEASVTPGTKLHAIYQGDAIMVKSMHHQGIKKLGDSLEPSVIAPDGLIEGLEGKNGKYLIGVQWHPEMLIESDEGTKRLFDSFVEASAAYANRSTAQ